MQFALPEQQKVIVECGILLMMNLTQCAKGKNSFLGLDNKDHLGYSLVLLTDYFVNGQTTSYFSYYPNVLANVSSTIPCRQEIIKKDYQIFEKLVPFMLDARQIARVGVCKLFRNCLFEYENYQFLYRVIDEKVGKHFCADSGESLLPIPQGRGRINQISAFCLP